MDWLILLFKKIMLNLIKSKLGISVVLGVLMNLTYIIWSRNIKYLKKIKKSKKIYLPNYSKSPLDLRIQRLIHLNKFSNWKWYLGRRIRELNYHQKKIYLPKAIYGLLSRFMVNNLRIKFI
jgi:hypothetical protein